MKCSSNHRGRYSALLITLAVLFQSAAIAAPGKENAQGKGGKADKAEAWYLKTLLYLEAEGRYVQDDRSGVIGRIQGAESGKDPHDIAVFEVVNGSPGAIVFVQSEEDFGDQAGQYLSDYRAPGNDKQVWNFTVITRLDNAEVTLYWDGLYRITDRPGGGYFEELDNSNKLLRNLRLVDLELGEVVAYAVDKKGVPQSYSFNMGTANQRQFRWIQGGVDQEDLSATTASRLDLRSLEAAEAMQRFGTNSGPPLLRGNETLMTTEPVERNRIER